MLAARRRKATSCSVLPEVRRKGETDHQAILGQGGAGLTWSGRLGVV